MFDIGFWELALIAMIALIVLGPKRLPEAARIAGQWVGRLRTFITNVKSDLDHQLQAEELAELRRLKEELTQTRETLEASSQGIARNISEGLDFDKQMLDSENTSSSDGRKKAKSKSKKSKSKGAKKKSSKSAKKKTAKGKSVKKKTKVKKK